MRERSGAGADVLDGPQRRLRSVWTAPSHHGFFKAKAANFAIYVAVTVVPAGRERRKGPHGSTRIAAPRARRRNARARSNFDMLLHITALVAAAATSPPFKTAVGLRPAARGLQDFAECPVLTKIKKDDCGDVKDFEALPVCSDSCLCKGMHCRAETTLYCGSEDKGSGHHNCAAAASSFTPRNRPR